MPTPRRAGGTSTASGGREHALVAEGYLAGGGQLQAGDGAQRGGLAAARGAEQHHKLAVLHVQGQVVHRQHLVVANGEVANRYARHRPVPRRASPAAQQAAQQHDLADVVGVVVRHYQRLAQQRLPGTMGERGIAGQPPDRTPAQPSPARSARTRSMLFCQASFGGGCAAFGQYPPGHSGDTCAGSRLNSRISHCAMRKCSSCCQTDVSAPGGIRPRAGPPERPPPPARTAHAPRAPAKA